MLVRKKVLCSGIIIPPRAGPRTQKTAAARDKGHPRREQINYQAARA
jgi:hypothetical protein